MARDPVAISEVLAGLIQPDARGRLLALGLARGMIWRDGLVPEGAPQPLHSGTLTPDLLDFGYGVLALALELRDANRTREPADRFETQEAFRVAAEAIESAVRRSDPTQGDQGRHLVISAAAFHLAGYAARSFSLLPTAALDRNLASNERALGLLLRRDLRLLRAHIMQWHATPEHTDERITARLADEDDSFDVDDAVVVALSTSYHRALGLADTALIFGDTELFATSLAAVEGLVTFAADVGNIPTWWVATLTVHLLRDLWDQSLHVVLPSSPDLGARWQTLRRDLIAQLGTRPRPQLDLWPSQIAAARRAVDPTDDLVIALPTSAGKTRIAELCILRALSQSKRTIYVTPLRALSAQIERVLARTFVPLSATVTSLYGASGVTMVDAQTLVSADIVVATPEKLDFALRQDPSVLDDVGLIIFDEGHMIGLGSREIRYEVLIQRLLRRPDADGRRIVCLSAMFNPDDPYFKDFGDWLRSDAPGEFVHVQWRPTRQRFATLDWSEHLGAAKLSFIDGEQPFVPRFIESSPPVTKGRKNPFPQKDIEFCICAANAFARDGQTVLVYTPVRKSVEPLASEFRRMSDQGFLTSIQAPSSHQIEVAQAIGREWLGEEHPAMRALEVGVGTHHGALPRPFLNAVEELLDTRRLSIIVASPTLAQGIDLACSVLVFRSLQRYEDGQWKPITTAEFSNVVGRAGRAFVDLDGIAVLPSYDPNSRAKQHAIFRSLWEKSRGQRLSSGLALLIGQIAAILSVKLNVPVNSLLDYVLNQQDMWDDVRLSVPDGLEDEDDQVAETLERNVMDLDVAILSLIEPLGADIDDLASILDDVLKDSLWKRTLAHSDERTREVERAVLHSRARWLWQRSTAQQREACFYAGLGAKPGLFLHDHLDTLIDILAAFRLAVGDSDADAAADAAIRFARAVMSESFFGLSKLPDAWEAVMAEWIKGTAFAEILNGLNATQTQRTQAFVQDGVVFRLVWAAEAVRVQSLATNHPRAGELGDGPAFALTYGVPSIPAALLCQMGFASRVGAVWVTRELSAFFTDMEGLKDWSRANDVRLSDPDFWQSWDHWRLWMKAAAPSGEEFPRPWHRKPYLLSVDWSGELPGFNTRVRVLPGSDRTATICDTTLRPLGTAELPFDPSGASLEGRMAGGERVRVAYFGPN
jgi:hypothetical protein